jgi:hypothetical protein
MSTRPLVGADEPDDPKRDRRPGAIETTTTGHIPEQPALLTRRKRQIVVAADRWENYGTVWFIRRGHGGEPVDETIRLEHDGHQRTYRGGGGGSPGADLEQRLTLEELATHFSRHYHHTKREQIPFGFQTGAGWSPRHASIRFQTVTDAATLAFTDREPRRLTSHGHCLVADNPRLPPTITALDAYGNDLGSFSPIRIHNASTATGDSDAAPVLSPSIDARDGGLPETPPAPTSRITHSPLE